MNRLVIATVLVLPPLFRAEAQSEAIAVRSVQITLLDEADLSAPESGLCLELLVEEGDRVSKGDLLIRLDDSQEQLKVERSQQELAIARKQAENQVAVEIAQKAEGAARSKLNLSKKALARYPKSVPEEQIEEETFVADKAKLEIVRAEFDLEVAGLNAKLIENELLSANEKLARKQIRSSLDGVVVEVNANAGEWVEVGHKLIRVVRLNRLRVNGFVSANVIPSELTGREAELRAKRDGRPDLVRTVKIRFVSPEANSLTGERRLWAEIDNEDGAFFPGMPATLTIGK
jgi:multidrug efflux pump subunit AcrA (membrane-fusion protein)